MLKAKYFPYTYFLNAKLGSMPSYTWKSVWAIKEVLQSGLGWHVGNGERIYVWEDAWVPKAANNKVQNRVNHSEVSMVAELIDSNAREWEKI